jgi:hypothetical protein
MMNSICVKNESNTVKAAELVQVNLRATFQILLCNKFQKGME